MKQLKIFSLILIFSIFAFALSVNISRAQDKEEDPMTLENYPSPELQSDSVTAEDLGLTTAEVQTPDQAAYWWSKFKNNVQSIFTFDSAKKAELEIKKANFELLAAQKMSENNLDSTKIQERFQQVLEKYKDQMAQVEARVQNLASDKKELLLEKIDAQHLKQQQILRELENKLPEQVKEKITEIRKERIEDWYTKHKENLEKRLEASVDSDAVGTKFKTLNTLATLEDMSEFLPTEAQDELETIVTKTQEKLQNNLQNLSSAEKIRLEKYLENINLSAIKKVQLIDNLKDDTLLGIRVKAEEIKKQELEKIESRYQALDDDAKESFLKNNFTNSNNGEASKIEILRRLQQNTSQELKDKIQKISAEEELKIKEQIRNTSNQKTLDNLGESTKELPVIRREIEEQKLELQKQEQERLRESEKNKLELFKKQQEQERERLKQSQED
ncbi:hypothetical protein H6761_02255 [Candidatus Nomurabacteria bacterium]|nr:hypothetical protein [Candidatus Nomurabacteria bacterium]